MEDSRLLPFCLIPLLDGYQGVPFFCLGSQYILAVLRTLGELEAHILKLQGILGAVVRI